MLDGILVPHRHLLALPQRQFPFEQVEVGWLGRFWLAQFQFHFEVFVARDRDVIAFGIERGLRPRIRDRVLKEAVPL